MIAKLQLRCYLKEHCLPARFSGQAAQAYFMVEGKAHWDSPPVFETYEDHRMAMAFAPFALLHAVHFSEPGVVEKSYPDFWRDLESLGFIVKEV